MLIRCFRCDKEIDTPDASNADYVIAQDTIVREPREVLVALKHNQVTLEKLGKETIKDSEYDAVEVSSATEATKDFGEDLVKVIAEVKKKDIQKTGIICPDCYRPTDTVIWGMHKK